MDGEREEESEIKVRQINIDFESKDLEKFLLLKDDRKRNLFINLTQLDLCDLLCESVGIGVSV